VTDVASPEATTTGAATRWAWLPPIGSRKYHALLLAMGMLVLGPIGGLTAAYMNFSLGFFVGGQVLAGILGSLVTFGYGAEGKHGANLIQTTAASVAGMSAMSGMIQALMWLGLPHPPLVPLMVYVLCIGMFGAGVGMLYTPLLVDRMKLTFPSGLAVANILRTLTDRVLLKRAVVRLTSGIGLGFAGSVAGNSVPLLGALDLSMSTFGAGMVVGSRIGLPTLVGSLVFTALIPTFISVGWLEPGDPYRKISFLISVGALLGASAVDLSAMMVEAVRRWSNARELQDRERAPDDWRTTNLRRLWLWTACWAGAIVGVGALLLHLPVGLLLFAIVLVFVFGLINGIAMGVSDFNPISAAVVITVLLMAALGLRDAMVGLVVSAVVFVSTNVATDMQQDRSTGWRLGTNRVLQFRYQVSGIAVGAVATIGFAQLFLTAYPVLRLDQTVMAAADQPSQWTSAATYKIVGILRSLSEDGSKQRMAIGLGVAVGVAMQFLRRRLQSRAAYQRFAQSGKVGAATEWFVDAVLLPSPYAFFFGGFINVITSAYFAGGGVLASIMNSRGARRSPSGGTELPSDMSTVSLVGGGLIAGESLAALTLGVSQLVSLL
jgi:uncharacterized oligopeptide transporter (OPT) family protein